MMPTLLNLGHSSQLVLFGLDTAGGSPCYVYFNFKLTVCQFLPCEFCLYFRFFFRELFTMSFLLTSFLLICFMIYYIVYDYLALAHLAVCMVCAHDSLSVLSCEFYESVVRFLFLLLVIHLARRMKYLPVVWNCSVCGIPVF